MPCCGYGFNNTLPGNLPAASQHSLTNQAGKASVLKSYVWYVFTAFGGNFFLIEARTGANSKPFNAVKP